MKNTAIMLIVLLGIAVVLTAIVSAVGKKGQKPQSSLSATTKTSQQAAKETLPKATFSLSPPTGEVALGKKLPLTITLAGDKTLAVSAVAIRFTYKFRGDPPLTPSDVKMKVNPLLLDQGWVFPVNTLSVDTKKGLVIGELAAINLTPTGFLLSREETIASIELAANARVQKLTIAFDQEESKVKTKNNEEVNLILKEGIYSIK